MLSKFLFFLFFLGSSCWSAIHSNIIATVNGTSLTEDEAKLILDKTGPLSNKDIEKIILFQLAVDKALEENFDKEVATATSIKKVLYKSYLRKITEKNNSQLQITKKELEAAYNESPLYRVYQIFLKGSPEANQAKLQKIFSEFKGGTPFRKLVLKYSEDQTVLQGGDLDYRSIHNFPEGSYKIIKSTLKDKISIPHLDNGNTILYQWTEKKSFAEAPETFKSFLTSKLSEQRELSLLRDALSKLREGASVELPKEAVQ